jgi:hypothetical protein
MDRWDQRLQGHNTEKREGGRVKYRTKLLLKIPVTVASDNGTSQAESQLEVWSRNISRGGVGFLSRDKILADNIVLCLNPNSDEQKWYHGVIVRRRPVQSEFWDYGVQLTGRADSGTATAGPPGN